MKKSFIHNRVYYNAILDDWIVIVMDCSGKTIHIYNTEIWKEWDESGVAVLNHAISIFCNTH